MSMETLAAGLAAYSLQIALLLAVGLLLPALFRLRLPRLRLAYWQGLLLVILLLPLLQPRSGTARIARFADEVWIGGFGAPALTGSAARSPLSWILFVLAAGILGRLTWLLLGLTALRAWRRTAVPADLPPAVAAVQEQVGARARFLVSDRVAGPVTFGWREATVLLPPGFHALPPAAQRAVVCHELLHVRRRDWLFSLFEETVRSLLWFHPAVWLLLSRLGLSREQVVDAEVVRLTGARRSYLEALRAIALQPRRAAMPGLPFFHHRGHLRERVAQLSKEVSMSRPRIATVVTAFAAVLALTAFLGASSFPMLGSAWAGKQQPMKVAGDVQRPKALSTPAPTYPDAAKADKAEGKVVVDCIIDEQGHVTQTKVSTSSGREDLDKSARDTLSTWSFQPATLKGKPVEVSYTITLNFKLDEKDKK
jgi:bla regulator protein blaR1